MAKRRESRREASTPAAREAPESERRGSKPPRPAAAGWGKPNQRNASKGSGPSPPPKKDFPLVGIGASAGGLEAFTQLLAHLPEDTGMGFVLIQHLDPKQESMILSRLMKMPLREVKSGVRVQPDNVYVVPPGTNMFLVDGTFQLVPRARRHEMPVDYFLRSLAEQTRRQTGFTRRVVDSSLDGILAFDRDFKVIVWNLAMERMFGVHREEALGRDVFEVLPFFKEIGEEEQLARALSGKNVASEDRPYVTRNGRNGFFEGHYSPLRGEAGQAIGCLVVIRETTSQKKFEEHLRQVQKLESLGTLSGGIAHDFNNILNIISAYTALIARDDSKKTPAHLAAIDKAVDRGAALVRHLLTFARRSDVEFKTVDINEVIEELDRLVRETFPRRLQTRLQLAKDLPATSVDPNQIHQALLNLCVNARDAMPGGGTLTLKTGLTPGAELRKRFPEARELPYVFVSVADTGQGMDEAVRARLFEPFFTTKESGQGAGLGLALVYGIVKTHLGFIDVESQHGNGAEFRIFLPVEPVKAANDMPRVTPAEGTAAADSLPEEASREDAAAQGGNETILFAEDEEMLSSAVKTLLESEGYKVLTVKDGEDALDLFRKRGEEIAISILDLQMPRLGGWETFLKMREIDPAAKVLIASGDLGRQERIEMKKAGIDGSIRKPYSAGQVMKAVRRALDRSPNS